MRTAIPLSKRKIDWLILGFFWTNILFITYQIDLEQLVVKDPSKFDYPAWPRPFIVDAVHWWGNTFDPALIVYRMWRDEHPFTHESDDQSDGAKV